MRARRSNAPTLDLDWIEGSLEMAESALGSVRAYHAGWSHLHPDDQRDYLSAFPAVEQSLAQLVVTRSRGDLEPDHATRLDAILALKADLDPLLLELRRPPEAMVPSTAGSGHPMVLDD